MKNRRSFHWWMLLYLLPIFFKGERVAAEHTVYIPQAVTQGNFFDHWLEEPAQAGVTLRGRHERALDSSSLGRFVGPDSKDEFTIGPRYLSDLFTSHFIHLLPGNEKQSVKIQPTHVLQKMELGLWGNITPAAWSARKHLGIFALLDAVSVEQQLGAYWRPIENKRPALERDYQDFFEGRYSSNNATILQTNLLYQKFTTANMRDSGLSSLTVGTFFQHTLKDAWIWRVQGLCSIPCGEKHSAEYLLKPRRNMGRHYGLGAAVDLKVPVWRWLQAEIGLRDFFWIGVEEMRTVGIKSRPFSYYIALGKQRQQNEPVFPAANVLTQECMVRPGHAMSMNFALKGKFSDTHQVFARWAGTYKEAERISLVNNWPSSSYAVVSGGYNTTQSLEPVAVPPRYIRFDILEPALPIGDAAFLQYKDLDFSVAGMPSWFEHRVEIGWQGGVRLPGGTVMRPSATLGARIMQGENAYFLPNIFIGEMGISLLF